LSKVGSQVGDCYIYADEIASNIDGFVWIHIDRKRKIIDRLTLGGTGHERNNREGKGANTSADCPEFSHANSSAIERNCGNALQSQQLRVNPTMNGQRVIQRLMLGVLYCASGMTIANPMYTVNVIPARPLVGEPVVLRFETDWPGLCVPDRRLDHDGSNLSMETNVISAVFRVVGVAAGGCSAAGGAIAIDLGRFPAGTYLVVAEIDGLPESRREQDFIVEPALQYPAARPTFDATGIWSPAKSESGWGLSLTQMPDGKLSGSWVTYGLDGQPTWFMLAPGAWSGLGKYHAPIVRLEGGPWFGRPERVLPPVPSPPSPTLSVVGHATLSFSFSGLPAPNLEATALFEYTVGDVSSSRALKRLKF
jgi:hypothetical protein